MHSSTVQSFGSSIINSSMNLFPFEVILKKILYFDIR